MNESTMIKTIHVCGPSIKIAHMPVIPCALGPAGVTRHKREGDGATPCGTFPLRQVLYRADRVVKPVTKLPVKMINSSDGWCDDPQDAQYNRSVTCPYPAHHEVLWRKDHLYDICVILGHNDSPPIPGKGSAIFFHLAHDDYRPTEGCVAVSETHMRAILALCSQETMFVIDPYMHSKV